MLGLERKIFKCDFLSTIVISQGRNRISFIHYRNPRSPQLYPKFRINNCYSTHVIHVPNSRLELQVLFADHRLSSSVPYAIASVQMFPSESARLTRWIPLTSAIRHDTHENYVSLGDGKLNQQRTPMCKVDTGYGDPCVAQPNNYTRMNTRVSGVSN